MDSRRRPYDHSGPPPSSRPRDPHRNPGMSNTNRHPPSSGMGFKIRSRTPDDEREAQRFNNHPRRRSPPPAYETSDLSLISFVAEAGPDLGRHADAPLRFSNETDPQGDHRRHLLARLTGVLSNQTMDSTVLTSLKKLQRETSGWRGYLLISLRKKFDLPVPDCTPSKEVADQLKAGYSVRDVEEVKIIRDKRNRASRALGFVRFRSVKAARIFIERCGREIKLKPNGADEATRVKIGYTEEKDGEVHPGDDPNDWYCPGCGVINYARRDGCLKCGTSVFQSQTIASAREQELAALVNTGDSDVGHDASQYLLFRALDAGVTEELLFRGASKLCQTKEEYLANASQPPAKGNTPGARPNSIIRCLLVRGSSGDASWKYGFVEFLSVDDAQAALTLFTTQDRFTISSKPVVVSSIHPGVFVPEFSTDPAALKRSFASTLNPSIRLRYWDGNGYISEYLNPKLPSEQMYQNSLATAGNASAIPGAAIPPVTALETKKAKKRKQETEGDTTVKAQPMASQLAFWANRHSELHEDDTAQHPSPNAGQVDGPVPPEIVALRASRSYADPTRNCCLLCARQFKTPAEVNKHERLSKLHAENLSNTDAVKKALSKLGEDVEAAFAAEEAEAYRDRAKERRATFKRIKGSGGNKQGGAGGGAQVSGANATPARNSGPAPPSKGAALLGKMGWSAGSGLGAEGTGMVDALRSDVYAAGVGLGAEGGKRGDAAEEAGRNTKGGYMDFLEKTREKAKERFEGMK